MIQKGALLSLVVALLGATACTDDPPAHVADEREVVILLHGLGRSAASMRRLGERLDAAGYRVENLDYASTTGTVDELVAALDNAIGDCCAEAGRLHFVTYSLGGILLRAYLVRHRPERLGRVVMIAPPNKGSEWVDKFGANRAFRSAYGPTGSDLGTGHDSLPNRLPTPDFEFGVIAGTVAINPVGGLLIPGDDDGTVSVENTKLPGMSDFLTLPHSHTFIINSPEAAEATRRFLATGRFDGAAPTPSTPKR